MENRIYNEVIEFDNYAKKVISESFNEICLDPKQRGEKQKSVVLDLNEKRRILITELEKLARSSKINKSVNIECHELLRPWSKVGNIFIHEGVPLTSLYIINEFSISLYHFIASTSDFSTINNLYPVLINIREFFQLLIIVLEINSTTKYSTISSNRLNSFKELMRKKDVRLDYVEFLEKIIQPDEFLLDTKFIKNSLEFIKKIDDSMVNIISNKLTDNDITSLVNWKNHKSWMIPGSIIRGNTIFRDSFTKIINDIYDEFRRSKK